MFPNRSRIGAGWRREPGAQRGAFRLAGGNGGRTMQGRNHDLNYHSVDPAARRAGLMGMYGNGGMHGGAQSRAGQTRERTRTAATARKCGTASSHGSRRAFGVGRTGSGKVLRPRSRRERSQAWTPHVRLPATWSETSSPRGRCPFFGEVPIDSRRFLANSVRLIEYPECGRMSSLELMSGVLRFPRHER